MTSKTPDSFFKGAIVNGMIFLAGKPGAGKGIESLRLIIAELLDPDSDRIVVTNCSLNLDKINDFLVARGREINVWERVYILEWEETARFYLRRSLHFCAEETRPDPKSPPIVDFSTYPPTPCLYVIDEAHEFFNSRNWQKVSSDTAVLAYISKHRHLGDGIVLISQTVASVDKQARERSQEYRITRNWSKERFGKFSKGTGFQVSSYLTPPTPSCSPQWVEERNPLPDFLNCYRTSLYNRKADEGKKTPGINFRKAVFLIIPIGALVPVLLYYISLAFLPSILGEEKNAGPVQPDPVLSAPAPAPAPDPDPSASQSSQTVQTAYLVTPPGSPNPLNLPFIHQVPPEKMPQIIAVQKAVPVVPVPFFSTAWTGDYHLDSENRPVRVGDYHSNFLISDMGPNFIETVYEKKKTVHPVLHSKPSPPSSAFQASQ